MAPFVLAKRRRTFCRISPSWDVPSKHYAFPGGRLCTHSGISSLRGFARKILLSHVHTSSIRPSSLKTRHYATTGGGNLIAAGYFATSRCRQLLMSTTSRAVLASLCTEEFVRETLELAGIVRLPLMKKRTAASHREHRLIATRALLPGCHINHLTPRTSGYRPGRLQHDAERGITRL